VQDPPRTRPANLARSRRRDLPAGHEARLTPLIHARVSDREHEPGAQPRTHAHIDRQTHDDRLTATRGPAATRTAPAASAVHIPAALGRKIAEPAAWHPRADRQECSAGSRDGLHLLPDDREAGR
jgi:hypothetical protein